MSEINYEKTFASIRKRLLANYDKVCAAVDGYINGWKYADCGDTTGALGVVYECEDSWDDEYLIMTDEGQEYWRKEIAAILGCDPELISRCDTVSENSDNLNDIYKIYFVYGTEMGIVYTLRYNRERYPVKCHCFKWYKQQCAKLAEFIKNNPDILQRLKDEPNQAIYTEKIPASLSEALGEETYVLALYSDGDIGASVVLRHSPIDGKYMYGADFIDSNPGVSPGFVYSFFAKIEE